MKSGQFIKWWFIVVSVAIIMIALLNYLIDPFGVFHTNLLTKSKSFNERVVKIDYLNAHKDRYDSFMFGSSTMGTTDPKVLEKYHPSSHFYNLTCSSSNMYDFKLLLRYLLEEGFSVKNLYLQIDLTSMREYGKHANHAQHHHYSVTKEPAWKFYLEYLTIFPFEAMKAKVMLFLKDANATRFDVENSGMWFVDYKDVARSRDLKAYIAREPSFKKHARRTRGEEKSIDAIMRDYREIVSLCKQHHVSLTLLTTAYNHLRLDAFKVEDMLAFLKKLATYHDIWYFSTYNTITNNDENYYEVNHYISKVGALKAARIYHDSEVEVPKDFGLLVTKENLEDMLSLIRENILAHDRESQKE
jgi:hypothetical protein